MERRLSRRDAARKVGAFAIISSLGLIPLAPGKRAAFAQKAATATPAAASPFASLGLQTLDLTLSANGVEGIPATLTAGRYALHLEPAGMLGQGDNQNQPGVMVVMLPSNVTMDDLAAMAATPTAGPPDWFYTTTLPGGVSSMPNTPGNAVVDLPAGNYFASGDGLSTPPVAFTVTGDLAKDLPEPESNATVTFKDYTIELTDGALKTGVNVIKIVNDGKMPHFLDLQKGPDGLTKEQVAATMSTIMSGTPAAGSLSETDFSDEQGTIAQSAGTTQWVTMTLQAGSYMAACWVPEPTTGVPHAEMGMYAVFTVK